MLSLAPRVDPGRLFSDIDFAGRRSVVVAVSGGGDSLALLLLLEAFVDRLSDAPRIVAVTVDHGLRAGSAQEAAAVAELCAARGISHTSVRWRGERPASGIAAAARAARYRLLAEVAQEAGTDIVLTGHTRDDQAETVAMRAARGAGRGAAGIAPATLHDGRIWFARPLLSIRRAALRAHLRESGTEWIDDPSNSDPRFERVRVRNALDDEAVEALAADADRTAAMRAEMGRRAAALIEAHARHCAPGLLRIAPDFLAAPDRNGALYVLRILLAVAGGRAQLPDAARAGHLLDHLGAPAFRATLSRAVAERSGDAVWLHREARNLPVTALSEVPAIWDGRYRVAAAAAEDLAVAPLGRSGAREAARAAPSPDVPPRLLSAALAAAPCLARGGTVLGPADGRPDIACAPVAAPWAFLMPSFDLAAARAATNLVAGEPVPAPPLVGHIEG